MGSMLLANALNDKFQFVGINMNIKDDDINWTNLTHEQKNHQLFLNQKALLDHFWKRVPFPKNNMIKVFMI